MISGRREDSPNLPLNFLISGRYRYRVLAQSVRRSVLLGLLTVVVGATFLFAQSASTPVTRTNQTGSRNILNVGETNYPDIASALAACSGPPCIIDSRTHGEIFSATITLPPFPVTILLGPYTYIGPPTGPIFLINDGRSNSSQIIGMGSTGANQPNQGNGTTLKSPPGNASDVVRIISSLAGAINGITLTGLTIDGNKSASNTLYLDGVRNSTFSDLNFQHCKGAMVYSTSSSAVADQGTQFNSFSHVRGADCARALDAEGNSTGTSDFTQNVIHDWSTNFSGDFGLLLHSADGNQFEMVKLYPDGNPSACLQFDSPVPGTVVGGIHNRFYGLHVGCLRAGTTVVAKSKSMGNSIESFDQSENQPDPTVEEDADLLWHGANGNGDRVVQLGYRTVLRWSGATGSPDTQFQRCDIGQLRLGNGTPCDSSGALILNYVGTRYVDIQREGALQISGTTLIDGNGAFPVGVHLTTTTTPPRCDVTRRGLIWYTEGGVGARDTLQVCTKDEKEHYAWRLLE